MLASYDVILNLKYGRRAADEVLEEIGRELPPRLGDRHLSKRPLQPRTSEQKTARDADHPVLVNVLKNTVHPLLSTCCTLMGLSQIVAGAAVEQSDGGRLDERQGFSGIRRASLPVAEM